MKTLLLILIIVFFSCKGTSQEKNTILKTNHQINFADLFNEGTIIKGKSTKNEELIISYQTEKHSKKIIEISADIYSLNTQHTIKITPKP